MKPVGLLLIDKAEGPSSHDVIAAVRRVLGERRIGHTGTLDPFASGLLLLCVGWATRLAEYVSILPKTYHGVIRLGERRDTDDRMGTVVGRSEGWRDLDERLLLEALRAHVGAIDQVPPAYSAKKVGGRRAYALARQGVRPKLSPRRVTVERIDLLEVSLPDLTVAIECSSGTYVRAVARDIGETLGVGAHLTALRRLRVGDFRVEEALRVDEVGGAEELNARLLSAERAIAHLGRLDVTSAVQRALSHGQPAPYSGVEDAGPLAIFADGRLAAIAEWKDGFLWPRKVLPGVADAAVEPRREGDRVRE